MSSKKPMQSKKQSDVTTRREAELTVSCLNMVWGEMLKRADICAENEDVDGWHMWNAKAKGPLMEMRRIEALLPGLPA